MVHLLKHRSLLAFDQMSPRDTSALLCSARTLQHAAQAGRIEALLRGKNLGLVCEQADTGEAALFLHAATELGAHVAQVRASLSEASTPHELQHTARLLGRLYDAVECQGMAPRVVQQVGDAAGVPVFDGIATRHHPTARLCGLLGGNGPPDDNRRFLLQAVLLSAIADQERS